MGRKKKSECRLHSNMTMNTHTRRYGICILSVLSCVLWASESGDSVAEFVLSEKLLQQFTITGTKKAPFQHHGQTMHPDIKLNVGINLKNSDNSVAAQLGVSLSGVTTTQTSKRVGPFKGHQVNVTVKTDLNANYTQDVLINQGGLNAGTPKGKPQIRPRIYTSNDFRLLNRKVNNVAYSTAQQMANEMIPKDAAQLNAVITSNLNLTTKTAQETIKKALGQVSGLVKNPDQLPYRSKFSSSTGENGNLKVEFNEEKKNGSEKKPKPELAHKEQEASRFMLHQDMLAELISREIAGQEMRLSDLKAHLCSEKTIKMMDFCKEALPKDIEDLSIIFEKEKPIEFEFSNGKIGMKLNASYRVAKEDKNATGALFTDPDKRDVAGRTIPYTVEFSYAVEGRKAKLASFSVKDRNAPREEKKGGFLGNLFGTHDSGPKMEYKADPSAVFLSPVIRQKLYDGFKGALKEELDWPVVSVPAKMEVDMSTHGAEPRVTDNATLMPLSTKVENGWLAFTSYYCSEKTPSFGVTYRDSARGKGINVSSVYSGSPADFLGLQAGDTILTVSKPGEATKPASENSFPDFIKENASKENTEERMIVVEGLDKKGQHFSKEVVLCPSNYPHKENADKLIQAAKKMTAK